MASGVALSPPDLQMLFSQNYELCKIRLMLLCVPPFPAMSIVFMEFEQEEFPPTTLKLVGQSGRQCSSMFCPQVDKARVPCCPMLWKDAYKVGQGAGEQGWFLLMLGGALLKNYSCRLSMGSL